MALPVIRGVKTANERFAGAEETYCIEALMQDGKALQAGTSHFLGQNFAKAFDVKFLNKENQLDYVWATSWGVSTRLVGALVMAHSDDQGLILPPKIAPLQVVIVPIYKGDEQKAADRCESKRDYYAIKRSWNPVKYDDNDNARPGWKFAEYELKGVPVRLALGARDLENNVVEVARRDTKEKRMLHWMDCTVYRRISWKRFRIICSIKPKLIWMNISLRLIAGMNLKNCWMKKEDLFQPTGMERPKQKKRSRKKQKPRFVAFRLNNPTGKWQMYLDRKAFDSAGIVCKSILTRLVDASSNTKYL